MRWESLFEDLAAQADEAERLEFEAEVAEQERAEAAAIRLGDRLRAHTGESLNCQLVDGRWLRGCVADAGDDWFTVETSTGQHLLPITAVAALEGLGRAVAPEPGRVARRLGLGVVLRGLAVRRAGVRLDLIGGASMAGTIDRVAADHVDLAVHGGDVSRRTEAVLSVRTVPVRSLLLVNLLP